MAPQPSIWGAREGQETWDHSAIGFPLACPCRVCCRARWAPTPHLGQGHPHCRVTWVEPAHGEHPRRKGCPLSLSSCPASVAVGAENFQKLHPGCVSDGCRTFPDSFLGALLLLAPGGGGGCVCDQPPLLPAALRTVALVTSQAVSWLFPPNLPRMGGAVGFGVAGLGAGRQRWWDISFLEGRK